MTAYEAFEYQPELHESYEQAEAYETFETQELHEALEFELAQELLEITTEAELEEFLGKLVRRVAKGASSFMKSGIGKAVGGVLRNVAKTALPMVGSALGSFVAPGLGTAIGGKLGGMAASLLEAEELESMGEAEAEMEAARRYVRWASGTVRNAMRAPAGVPPRTVARSAAVSSARRYAPALVRPSYAARTQPWRSRRASSYGRSAWAAPYGGGVGFAQAAPYAPFTPAGPVAGGCSCGGHGGGQSAPDFEPFDGDFESYETQESQEAMEAFESHEAHEAHEVGGGGGRWYRRGNRIVLVGA
ncbi:hypothetical protein [Nocardioides cavernaquae]|uniref:Uncharacterized protein n=1 Tax=Nocardioides cavernaquae TaxID=2321396 RepID=A0A3A5HHV4_9ACTN|nr:hypothetical protein [Nocardioides cavernaquae]RJS47277.1 hypothetical protein D4739_14300 [Nocardioides cavernaquae]